ncbi:DNA polymerase II large subunit-like protein [Metarhizium album ARSEF 1941]|uniref:DNA polymerase II large subunit-like protein n=1 Tax=Metarhizium album (strain ARSEF 1941) TaxID=1081103 RepID=A0A0B2X6I7_METAS|nr:DNA polymerase II large subunit-like protein [Metarhizium album ARSEF 1941]KHO01085.1 DNA polymerase II large subunit-like protein [Metarhizium album ARSEF 1941]
MDSDDSEFYGSPEERRQLQSRVDGFDARAWARQHSVWGFGSPCRRPSASAKSAELHNPYAGISCARQLAETLDDFLSRLPPATTDASEDTPWIFICNPYVSRKKRHDDGGEFMKGNEFEAPTEDESHVGLVVEGGMKRLELLTEFRQKLELSGRSAALVKRELVQEQSQAVADILRLAQAGKVRSGKWMLFCPPSDVNEVWGRVARATAHNELGIAAKVSPRPQFDHVRKDRIICIYTSDFQDKSDVGRVLRQLRNLKLVGPGRPIIYYKPDIFTYIGLSHGNPWGLAASIYNSKTFES